MDKPRRHQKGPVLGDFSSSSHQVTHLPGIDVEVLDPHFHLLSLRELVLDGLHEAVADLRDMHQALATRLPCPDSPGSPTPGHVQAMFRWLKRPGAVGGSSSLGRRDRHEGAKGRETGHRALEPGVRGDVPHISSADSSRLPPRWQEKDLKPHHIIHITCYICRHGRGAQRPRGPQELGSRRRRHRQSLHASRGSCGSSRGRRTRSSPSLPQVPHKPGFWTQDFHEIYHSIKTSHACTF